MSYSLRIRLNRSPTDSIQSTQNEIQLPCVEPNHPITLRASPKTDSILAAKRWAIFSTGYDSPGDAEIAGRKISDALTVAFARVRIGADFGTRGPRGFVTKAGQAWLREETGARVLSDVHGLQVFESEPTPHFLAVGADATRGVSLNKFDKVFSKALQSNEPVPLGEELAYALFHASFFQNSADSKFLVLVMAIEAMIDPQPRSKVAIEHVETLIEQTKAAAIPDQERNSILGALKWLRNESINQAGKRLVNARLAGRVYGKMTAEKYFTYCYGLRSSLVHGKKPAPEYNEISSAAGILESLVSDLLTCQLIGFED